MTAWLDGFDRIDGVRDYGGYRRGDLSLFLLRHTWEGIGANAQWHIDYVRKRMRNARPHFVAANPHTTALAYQKAYGGSKARVSDSEVKEGYEYLGQAQPTDGPSWSLRGIYQRNALGQKKPRYVIVDGKSVAVESNHANVWQTEFVSWAADMRNLTDEELEWERDKVWLPQCRAGGITELIPWEKVGSNKKIPDAIWMSPSARKEFNFGGHQHMPKPNNHWDSGPYPYGEMATEVNKVLAGGVLESSPPVKKVVVPSTGVEGTTTATTDNVITLSTSTTIRPQQIGRAKQVLTAWMEELETEFDKMTEHIAYIENEAQKELNKAAKLLTPKDKKE